MAAVAVRARGHGASSRALPVAMATLLSLAFGCEAYLVRGEQRIPDEIRQATAEFVEALHQGRTAELEARFSPEAWNPETRQFLEQFSGLLSLQPAYELKPGTYDVMAEDGNVYHTFGAQIGAGGHYHAVKITFRETDGALLISGAAFYDLPGDLEQIHRFTLEGRSPVFWLLVAGAVAIPIFVIWSIVDCWKSRRKLRWLWIPVILTCFPILAVNWSSQQATLSLSVLLLGVDYFQPSRLSPATVAIGLPVGAIAWQIWRRVGRAPADPGSGASADPAPGA